MRAAAHLALDRDELDGVTVGIEGVGRVGSRLAALLVEARADVFVADVLEGRAESVAAELGATALPIQDFALGEFDIFAPCALGGAIGFEEANRLAARIVVGAANNPLTERGVATTLAARDILYVPDFIASSGGIIHVGAEVLGLDSTESEGLLSASVERCARILSDARREDRLPLELAEEQAEARLREGNDRVARTRG